ncbi:major facilitator superfamily domain-containing protein [Endogone sp. FLAS-F59071]|nr:major facilitator superfamily domain-containing protein [Endogone sp. FLAS-F59071]|eukprot:RUS18594.1 major facilitator superfamily domain-containing protein [Endogone sp. FLAS-F59071]
MVTLPDLAIYIPLTYRPVPSHRPVPFFFFLCTTYGSLSIMKKANIPAISISTTDLPHSVPRTRIAVNPGLTELRGTQAQEIPMSPGSAASENIESMEELDMASARTLRSLTLSHISRSETGEIIRSTEFVFGHDNRPSEHDNQPSESDNQPSEAPSSFDSIRADSIRADSIRADSQLLQPNEKAPEEGRVRSRRVPLTCVEITITVVCLVFGIIAWSIIDPLIRKSLPMFASEPPFNAPQDKIPWAEQASIIASTSCAPLYARFSDVYGRRRLLSIALTLLIVGQALCMVTASLPMIIAAKIISGAGGGGVYPLAFVILADIEPLEKRARHTAPWAVVFTTSSLLMPQAGQVLMIMSMNLWRWLFLIPMIFGVVALLFVFLLPRSSIHPGEKRDDHKMDWRGSFLIIIGIVCLLAAVSWSSQAKAPSDQMQSQMNQALSSTRASTSGAMASISSMVKSAQPTASGVVASAASLATSAQIQILPTPTSSSTTSAQLKARQEKRELHHDDCDRHGHCQCGDADHHNSLVAAGLTTAIANGVQFDLRPADSTAFATDTLTLTATTTDAASMAVLKPLALFITKTLITTVVVIATETHTVSGTTSGSSTVLDTTSSSIPFSPSKLGTSSNGFLIANTNSFTYNQSGFNLSLFDKGSSYALLAACHPVPVNSTNSNGSASGTAISYKLWTSVLVALFVVGSVFISAFVYEQHGQGRHEATIPLYIFKDKTVSTIFAVEVLFGAVFSGIQNFLPIYYSNLGCNIGSVSGLNALYPLLGSTLAATIFVLILTRYRLYRLMSLLGAVLMLIGTITLRITMALPEVDTHVLDGVSLFIACVSVVITFQILALWAQSKCESDKDLRAVVTGLTQCFFMFGQALGYTITKSIFSNHLADELALIGIPVDTVQWIVNHRSLPNQTTTPDMFEAYIGGQQLVYHGFLIPCMTVATVLIIGTWIWAKEDAKEDANEDANEDAKEDAKDYKDDV